MEEVDKIECWVEVRGPFCRLTIHPPRPKEVQDSETNINVPCRMCGDLFSRMKWMHMYDSKHPCRCHLQSAYSFDILQNSTCVYCEKCLLKEYDMIDEEEGTPFLREGWGNCVFFRAILSKKLKGGWRTKRAIQ